MIKICYLLLTMSSGDPTLINFNDVIAVNQGQANAVGWKENRIYFKNASALGAASIVVKETVEEIAEKIKSCKPGAINDPTFIFVGE